MHINGIMINNNKTRFNELILKTCDEALLVAADSAVAFAFVVPFWHEWLKEKRAGGVDVVGGVAVEASFRLQLGLLVERYGSGWK